MSERQPRTEAGKQLWALAADDMPVQPDDWFGAILDIEDQAQSMRWPAPSTGAGPRLDALRVLRLTGEQLDGVANADDFAVDWDEFEEFVRLDDVRAALASGGAEGSLDVVLGSLDEDDVMYDHPRAMSGEPLDPVLFVRWDAIVAALTPRVVVCSCVFGPGKYHVEGCPALTPATPSPSEPTPSREEAPE